MTVCKFFQQGYCRYGQNCRFEHVYGSKYTYHAPQSQPPQTSVTSVTDEQLVNQVQIDIQAVLNGGQWVLSSYAPYKEKGNVPGISDLSPEEARLFIYEAKSSNNIDQAVAYMNNLFKETRCKYEQLLQPSASIIKVLRSIYKGESVSSPFSNTQNSDYGYNNSAASSIFRSAIQNAPSQNSIFNQNPISPSSVFAQNQTLSPTNPSVFNQNVFGPSNPDQAKSIFAQANTNAFSQQQSVFTSPETAAKSIFAQANSNIFAPSQANPANIFAVAQQKTPDPISQKQNQFNQSTNVFQIDKPKSVAGPTVNVFQQVDDAGVYSKIEDLTEDDIEAFKSDSFKLGFIPEIAPTQALCVGT